MIFENVQGPTRDFVQWLGGGEVKNAVTIGHIILHGGRFDTSNKEGARWLAHESGHVRQAEQLGVFYLPV